MERPSSKVSRQPAVSLPTLPVQRPHKWVAMGSMPYQCCTMVDAEALERRYTMIGRKLLFALGRSMEMHGSWRNILLQGQRQQVPRGFWTGRSAGTGSAISTNRSSPSRHNVLWNSELEGLQRGLEVRRRGNVGFHRRDQGLDLFVVSGVDDENGDTWEVQRGGLKCRDRLTCPTGRHERERVTRTTNA